MDPQILNFIVTIISLLLGVASIIYSIASTRQVYELKQQNKTLQHTLDAERQIFDWDSIHKACRGLAKKVEEFKPDFIISTPGAPLAVAALVVEELYEWIPVHVVMVASQGVKNVPAVYQPGQHEIIESIVFKRKWYVPKVLLSHADVKIVVIDDITFSAVFFEKLLGLLSDKANIPSANVLTASLIASRELAEKGRVGWSYYRVSNTSLYLPWGKEQPE